jgi:hypothetical protein
MSACVPSRQTAETLTPDGICQKPSKFYPATKAAPAIQYGFSTDCRLPCFFNRSLNASTAKGVQGPAWMLGEPLANLWCAWIKCPLAIAPRQFTCRSFLHL